MTSFPSGHLLALSDWQSFYVIVGSSAAALTGLTFIVITLAADDRDGPGSASARLSGLRVFITPTAVHFGIALWLAALMSMPGQTAASLAILLAGTGLGGLAYCGTLLARLLGRTLDYKPFASDWVWSVLLPLIAYLGLLTSGLTMTRAPSASLYAVSGAAMLLLLIGIHNAWDVVVWMTTERHARRERQRRGGGSSRGNPR